MKSLRIVNAVVNIEGKITGIHAKLLEQTDMPKISGRMFQHMPGTNYSWATLNYDLGNNTTLYLRL